MPIADVLGIWVELRNSGLGILVVSSEPETILAVSGSRSDECHAARSLPNHRTNDGLDTGDLDQAGIDMTVEQALPAARHRLTAVRIEWKPDDGCAGLDAGPAIPLLQERRLQQLPDGGKPKQPAGPDIDDRDSLAAGMTFVLLTAQIDLSVAAIMALSGMIAAQLSLDLCDSRTVSYRSRAGRPATSVSYPVS